MWGGGERERGVRVVITVASGVLGVWGREGGGQGDRSVRTQWRRRRRVAGGGSGRVSHSLGRGVEQRCATVCAPLRAIAWCIATDADAAWRVSLPPCLPSPPRPFRSAESLYDRLTARGYSDAKRRENVEAEVHQVVLDEVIAAFPDTPRLVLWGDMPSSLERNVAAIAKAYGGLEGAATEGAAAASPAAATGGEGVTPAAAPP